MKVLAGQELDLIYSGNEIGPQVTIKADFGLDCGFQFRINHPLLDPAVVVCLAHGKRLGRWKKLIRCRISLVSNKRRDVVNGAGDASSGFTQAGI